MEKTRKLFDILRLPSEILVQIFRWCSLGFQWKGGTYYSYPTQTCTINFNLVAISLVCRRWKNICYSSPDLWSRMYWSFSSFQHFAEPPLLRARSLPISMFIDAPDYSSPHYIECHEFLKRHASQFGHLEGISMYESPMEEVVLPNTRSINFLGISCFFTTSPNLSVTFPMLDAIEAQSIYGPRPRWHHGGQDDDELLVAYDLRSTSRIQKLSVIEPFPPALTTILILPISETLVHLHLGCIRWSHCGPMGPPLSELQARTGCLSIEISLPRLQTLDFFLPWAPRDTSIANHPYPFFKKIKCRGLRRLRCSSPVWMGQESRGAEVRRFDTEVLLWGIRSCLPAATTSLPASEPYCHIIHHPITPALMVLERNQISTEVAEEIHIVASCSSQTLTIVVCTAEHPSSSPLTWDGIGPRPPGGAPPPLDLDMHGSFLPSPWDPFWDRYIHAIYRIPGLGNGRTTGEENDGKNEDRFKDIPTRWWPKCQWGWEEFKKAIP